MGSKTSAPAFTARLAHLRRDPRRRQAVHRFAVDTSAQPHENALVGDREEPFELEPARAGGTVAHANAVRPRIAGEIVAQPHAGQHDADVGRQRAPHFADAVEERLGERRHQQLRELGADLDRDCVDADQAEGELGAPHRAALADASRVSSASASPAAAMPVRGMRDGERTRPEHEKERARQRRHQRERDQQSAGAAQHVGTREELRGQVRAQRAVGGHARDHHAHRSRDEEGGKRGDQRVADREQRERIERIQRREPVVGYADEHAAGEIQRDDDERGDRIAFDELTGAVHRSVEVRLALNGLALAPRPLGIEDAGVNVGVDRHLLAGHGVEREARRYLGHALRAARDDDELDRHEDRKDDQSDDQVSAHDEGPERGNDRADRARRGARRQDQTRRRNVEREAEERRDQQRRRKRRELERILDGDREQQHQRRAEDVDAEQDVEQPRRQRHDENADDREQQGGEGVDRSLVGAHVAASRRRASAMTTSATAT